MNKYIHIFIHDITSWKTFHLFSVIKYIFLYSLTRSVIPVMTSPTGQIAKILELVYEC